MSDYTLSQAEFVRLKGRLTAKENKFKKAQQALREEQWSKGKQQDVVTAAKALQSECDYALGIFAEKGHPDDWHRWERAKDDAAFQIQRYSHGPGIYS